MEVEVVFRRFLFGERCVHMCDERCVDIHCASCQRGLVCQFDGEGEGDVI